jgi:transcriptional regulator with XRE-family HTH domain
MISTLPIGRFKRAGPPSMMPAHMGVFRERVGARVRQLRRAAGLTQEQLARRAGMDYKYLGSVERGERNVTLENLERIVRALDVEPYDLFAFRADAKKSGAGTEDLLVNLARKSDPAIRPLIVEVVQSILHWAQAKRK